MKACLLTLLLALASTAVAQKTTPPPTKEKTTQAPQQPDRAAPAQSKSEEPTPFPEPSRVPEQARPSEKEGPTKIKWDMTETAPVVTHHEIKINGKPLKYTARVGRMPIKDASGNTEALMFYVAYTLDGADPATRPLTFAFNGGPGSASIWLHMGALGPRKVALQPEGWMPASPYRLIDNENTLLDRSDLVLVDAIGAGWSRPADLEKAKKFWSVKGDIEAFGEFVRMFITRNERWSSPLYLLGESYGTTRAAGVSGYLTDKGIVFNGVTLLSEVLDFQTIRFARRNDEPFLLILPSYAMAAAYHKKLAPELAADLPRLRTEVEDWVWNTYAPALSKGDAMTTEERQRVIDGLVRYTGLKAELIDQQNLRIDVPTFTRNLLADRKLLVGRLDGRYSGPVPLSSPDGFEGPEFFDPTSAHTGPPFTAVFNDYVRRELNYKTDMPYYVFAQEAPGLSGEGFRWDWGSAGEGWTDTASALRSAMAKNPYLKVLVMEGYYDLATPYFAADYTMNHLGLPPEYRKNISFATYPAGHMMYTQTESLVKMKKDLDKFIDSSLPK
jgi:carboxypeptidase C (cathepsin A)